MKGELTHFDHEGKARMVDVSSKDITLREAVARAEVLMSPETLAIVRTGGIAKGDVLGVSRIAGIMAAKEAGKLIPMAHSINLTAASVDFILQDSSTIIIETRVRSNGKTGVEMEALTAASVAALTIYDMCKSIDRGMVINNIRLVEKTGGKSGTYLREGESCWEK